MKSPAAFAPSTFPRSVVKIAATLVRTVALGIILAATTAPARAESTPATDDRPAEVLDRVIRAGAAGHWSGTLEYRDYGSNAPVSIPARAVVESSDTAPILLRRITFTDPGREIVSNDIAMFDSAAGTLREVSLDGGPSSEYEIAERVVRHEHDWRIVLRATGTDDQRPADLRLTWVCDGDRLVATKEVRFRDDESRTWIRRNTLRLQRRAPALDDLSGRWLVDLRPTPDSAPYTQPLVLSVGDDGAVSGTFYGSRIEDFVTCVAQGTRHLAFVTRDESNTYFTSARVLEDRIVGRTHSPQREFLSVWSARRPARPGK